MTPTLDRLERAERFNKLFETPLQVPGTLVTLRIPAIFTTAFNEQSADPVSNKGTIDPDRVQPPFVKLPGFRVCYERYEFGAGEGSLPIYCYLAAQEGVDKSVPETIQMTLAEAFPEAEVAWKDVNVDSAKSGGPTTVWKRLEIHGPQMFAMPNSGKMEEKAGMFSLWYLADTEHNYQILIGWRQPESTMDRTDLRQFGPLVAATVEFVPPAEEAETAEQPAAE